MVGGSWIGRKSLHAGLRRFRGHKARRQICALVDGPVRSAQPTHPASQVHRHPEVPARSVSLEERRRPRRRGRILRGSLPLARAR
jgi:hypothetical protein